MAKFRLVNTHFWKDPYIRKLSAGYKMIFLYLLTNPSTNIAGCYEISMDEMVFDTGISEKKLLEAFDVFSKDGKVTYKNHWILIHNFIKNQTKTEKTIIGIKNVLNDSPDWVKDTLSKGHLCPSDYLNLNLKFKPKPKRRFAPDVVEVFEEWKTTLNKKSSLDAKRHKILAARLADFSVADLKLVPHGVLRSPWHNGDNPAKRKYHDISTIYRDNEQVEKFIELARIPTVVTTVNREPTQREIAAIDREKEIQWANGVQ